jgi:hypothetical protein
MKAIPELTDAQQQRFWSKIDRCGPDDCWEWIACRSSWGYGQVKLDRVVYLAHRVTYFLTNGQPGNLCVCHICDNPGCNNPRHLFLGTDADNMSDKVIKNRQVKGETNGRAVLTAGDVLEIRRSQLAQKTLAQKYGIDPSTVSAIIRRRIWKHLERSIAKL